ncbi:MAG: lytic transglycosylase domain-containing protein [Nitrospirota bacterium]
MVRLTMKRTLIVFVPILSLFTPHFIGAGFSVAYADIYKYIDENGVVCYTNAPFGKKADIVIREEVEAISYQPRTERKNSKDTTNYRGIIHEKATKYKIDPSLVKAVIKTESNWNERAVSREGAMGLMQLMPFTASEMDVRNPFNPEENIEGGTRYLKYLLDRFNGDLNLTLAAYNAGPRSVKKLGLVPPITETRQYVDKVLSLYKNGRTTHPSLALDKLREKRPEPIYKVILEDGTLLFTNSTLLLKDAVRF